MAAPEGDLFLHVSVNATRARRLDWGDTQYAEGLVRAIRRIPGCDGAVFFRDESPEPRGRGDVVLRIVGPHLEEPVPDMPNMPNMLWIISPPNLMPPAMLRRYQAVFSASQRLVELLREAGTEADYLPQATEGGHFHPDRRPEGAPDLPVVFVGGFAPRVDRRMVLFAVEAGFDVQIWGPGWAGVVPDRHLRGERLDYDQLAEVYASARVVLNSHMPMMRHLGFMSNRSFDAIASGAWVVSDRVQGFHAPNLPELLQADDRDGLAEALARTLDRPPPDHAARLALHGRLMADFDFGTRAGDLVRRARALLAGGLRPAPAFRPGRAGAGRAGPVRLVDPAASAASQERGMILAAREILVLAAALEHAGGAELLPPEPVAAEGVIHPLMADLREMQALATTPPSPEAVARIGALVARARRLIEVLTDDTAPYTAHVPRSELDPFLIRATANQPLWHHRPQGFDHQSRKTHVMLRPRQVASRSDPPVGVFLHLFHDDLAGAFAERLARIDTDLRVYVSTDTEAKAGRIRASLPGAEVRVLPNCGRDIWPKLYGFGDAHDRHEIVLHLHGKKSPHSDRLNDWLAHILDGLLGAREDVNRILSMFRTIPELGLVTPVAFRNVLSAAHWGANRDIARELAFRMGLPGGLPGNDGLRFPVGSMFWGRVAAIRPLLDLKLWPGHFPPEAGQVDGTLAHAVERMLGVVCEATGHKILSVTGSGQTLHGRYRKRYGNNRELRKALIAGEFDA